MTTETTKNTKKNTKKTSIIWGTIGGILTVFGIFLIAYTGYILYSKSEHQKISEILPSNELEFVLFSPYTSNSTSPEKKFFTHLFSPLFSGKKEEVVAIYTNNEVVVISKKDENDIKNSSSSQQYCENIQKYEFCASLQHKTRIISIIDSIKNKAPSLQKDINFIHSQKTFTKEKNNTTFFFFGKTPFIKNIIWKNTQHFLDNEIKENIFNTISIIEKKSPYISGSIQNQKFTLLFAKSEQKRIFSNVISEYDISEYFLSPSTDRYLLIKKPKVLWDTLFSQLEAKNFSTEFFTKKTISQSFSTFFTEISPQGETPLQFQKDILPLFEGDVLWAGNTTGNAIIYSLPKKTITSEVFEKFSHTIEKIAQWSIPSKVAHTLKDGTTVYEVFPNEENISIEKDYDENGTKLIFSNDLSHKKLGIIQRDTFLMVANDQKFLSNFWDLSGEKPVFTFPKTAQYFFSLGFQKRSTEKSPILFAEISGKESPESFEISGNIQWNIQFFEEKNEEIDREIDEKIDEEKE